MTNKQSFVSADHCDRDFPHDFPDCGTHSKSAIVRADISENFREYLETFNAFYASEGVFHCPASRQLLGICAILLVSTSRRLVYGRRQSITEPTGSSKILIPSANLAQ
jgi:hypothetical protein